MLKMPHSNPDTIAPRQVVLRMSGYRHPDIPNSGRYTRHPETDFRLRDDSAHRPGVRHLYRSS